MPGRRLNGDLHMKYMKQLYQEILSRCLSGAEMTRITFRVAQDVSHKMFLSL